MSELGPLDSGFMEMEDADRHISLGIGAVAIIAGPVPTRQEFTAAMAGSLVSDSRLRQRVRRTVADLTAPVWEDDPNFDLAHHLRWTALPEPGDEAALRELVAAELEERLDRDHPLWQCIVVEHLAADRWALIIKAHHTMVDGASGIGLFESLCDPESSTSAPRLSTGTRQRINAFGLAAEGIRLSMAMPRMAFDITRALIPVVYAAVTPTGTSSFNGPIGRQRRYAVARTSLADIAKIRAAFGVTVNDVALAAIASAYRTVLHKRGEEPTADKIRILVPVSMRREDAKYVLDNRVSAMLPYLPVEISDPVERLTAVHQRIARHRSRGEAEAEKSVLSMAGRLPFAFVAWTLRLAMHYPQHGVSALATNVPGPRRKLSLQGREVLEILPCIPIAMRLRTTIAILSYTDRLTFGITGDYDTTPDIDLIADEIEHGITELLDRARERNQKTTLGDRPS
ncbi:MULTISPECIES: wax ester/triacylglycerol synthase family O-acyltransferase [unclassified Nocardia]|uniref:wax ester/triacylglycerol synthase family O-acyltransferase n=1 Tax=unclassified Nocardia TaxID=2637762 RepID=UPI003430599C